MQLGVNRMQERNGGQVVGAGLSQSWVAVPQQQQQQQQQSQAAAAANPLLASIDGNPFLTQTALQPTASAEVRTVLLQLQRAVHRYVL